MISELMIINESIEKFQLIKNLLLKLKIKNFAKLFQNYLERVWHGEITYEIILQPLIEYL
jgi:hypothetical protein